MNKKKIFIIGNDGRMGVEITRFVCEKFSNLYEVDGVGKLSASNEQELIAKIKAADLILDFSHFENTRSFLKLITDKNLKSPRVLIGTTGHSQIDLDAWKHFANKSDAYVLFAPNTSLGILALKKAADLITSLLDRDFSSVLIDTHHDQKVDKPSGTAKLLQTVLPADTEIISIRAGGIFGEHEIRFIGQNEEIKISHRAFNRSLFAEGALRLGEKLLRAKNAGFYTVDTL